MYLYTDERESMDKRNIVPTIAVIVALAAVALAVFTWQGTGSAEAQAPEPVEQQQPTKAATPQESDREQPVRVTVVDQTGDRWHGLQAAVDGWNRSPLVHMEFSDVCQPETYCIIVDAWEHGAEWAGLTSFIQPGIAHIQANASLNYPLELQGAVMCHELGHALGGIPDGLTGGNGCIAGGDETNPVPTRDDLALLKRSHQWGALAWADATI